MRIIILAICVVFCITLNGQTPRIDSLKTKLDVKMPDTATVNRFIEIADAFFKEGNLDSCYHYATKASSLSKSIHWNLGEAKGIYYTLGYRFFIEHNYVQTLSDCLNALSVFEEEKDSALIVSGLEALAIIYFAFDDLPEAMAYTRRAMDLATLLADSLSMWEAHDALSNDYYIMGKADSAFIYAQKAYLLSNYIQSDTIRVKAASLLDLAQAAYLEHDYELATSYLRKARQYSQFIKVDDNNINGSINAAYGEIYIATKKWDSALAMARKSNTTYHGDEFGAMTYYGLLTTAKIFKNINKDSAIKYFDSAHQARKGFDDKVKAQINQLTQKETDRQKELRDRIHREQVSRSRNIQYTAIAICLATLVILFMIYSRSIIASGKLIRFLGVVVLLIVYEFVNLYIHPFVSHVTNDSPVLMLLTMVLIASLLVPAHHRIERLVTHQLTEKNKKIRLAAAKKIIQEAEKSE